MNESTSVASDIVSDLEHTVISSNMSNDTELIAMLLYTLGLEDQFYLFLAFRSCYVLGEWHKPPFTSRANKNLF